MFVPTPIPPAAVNEDGIVCIGRGRMWAGGRAQSVEYSVTEGVIYKKFTTRLFFWFDHNHNNWFIKYFAADKIFHKPEKSKTKLLSCRCKYKFMILF